MLWRLLPLFFFFFCNDELQRFNFSSLPRFVNFILSIFLVLFGALGGVERWGWYLLFCFGWFVGFF